MHSIACYCSTDEWKIVYRRPKYVSSGYTNEVTGPWFDNSYYHEEILTYENVEPTSSSVRVLKSEMVGMWEHMGIFQVITRYKVSV